MSKFRAILVGKAISISELDAAGDVVRHVATVPPADVPQFIDDVEAIKEEVPRTIFGFPVVFVDSLPGDI